MTIQELALTYCSNIAPKSVLSALTRRLSLPSPAHTLLQALQESPGLTTLGSLKVVQLPNDKLIVQCIRFHTPEFGQSLAQATAYYTEDQLPAICQAQPHILAAAKLRYNITEKPARHSPTLPAELAWTNSMHTSQVQLVQQAVNTLVEEGVRKPSWEVIAYQLGLRKQFFRPYAQELLGAESRSAGYPSVSNLEELFSRRCSRWTATDYELLKDELTRCGEYSAFAEKYGLSINKVRYLARVSGWRPSKVYDFRHFDYADMLKPSSTPPEQVCGLSTFEVWERIIYPKTRQKWHKGRRYQLTEALRRIGYEMPGTGPQWNKWFLKNWKNVQLVPSPIYRASNGS